MKKITIKVDKIKTQDDAVKIEKELKKDKNINNIIVNKKNSTIEITYNKLSINEIENKIEELGYISLGVDLTPHIKKKSKIVLILLGILLIIILLLSIGYLLKLSFLNVIDIKTRAITLFIITILFLLYGSDILLDGIKGRVNLNTLLSIAIISSFIYGTYYLYKLLDNNIIYNNYNYLEIIMFLIYFKKIGDYLEYSNSKRINTEIKQLTNTAIKKVKVKTPNGIKEMNIENVNINDIVICYPGDLILLDGTIVDGYSHTLENLTDGKSLPIEKERNTIVISGSMNCEDKLEYKVDRLFKDSYISNIKKIIVEEKNNKKKSIKKIDKYSSYLFIISIIISLTIGTINYLITNSFSSSVNKSLLMLILFCPFGLAISSPISFRRTIKSKKTKVLIKSIESLEQLRKIDTIVFDKTSTLTNGFLSISRINNHSNMTDKELLELLGSIEKNSTYATARGISKYLRGEKIKCNIDFATEDLSGYGVKAKDDKDFYYVCNSELLKKIDINNQYKEEERKMRLDGNDVIYLVKNTKIIATFGLKDIIKKDVLKLINILKEKNIEIIMLTGDDKETSEKIAKKLGIKKVVSNLNAIEKANYVKNNMKENKKVLMVGEGVNDSVSLACANIGITIKNASDIPVSSSDIIITNDNLFKILDLFSISKSTIKLLRENVFLSLLPSTILFIILLGLIPKITVNSTIIILGLFISFILVLLNTLRVKNK